MKCFSSIFLSNMQLGTSKNACQKFFEKSLTNFECALSVHSKKPPAPFCNFLILLSAHSVSRLCVCVNIQKMSSTNFFLVSILQFSTNEFHAGSDTRCDEENDFDAIFGALFLYHHTRIITPSHSLQLVWASLLSCWLHSYHKKKFFRRRESSKQPIKSCTVCDFANFYSQYQL